MKYIKYGLILAAGILTVLAMVYWRPDQMKPEQSYLAIKPNPGDYIEYDIELSGAGGEEPIAVYEATYIPQGRDRNGRYYVKLLDGDRRELPYRFTVLYLRPAKMADGHYVIFSSVYLEDNEGGHERSAPAVETGLPAFDPLIGAGYLAFPYPEGDGDVKLVITYAVDLGSDDAYGPAFAELTIPEEVWR